MDKSKSVKRTGIFCFYNEQGQVSDDILYLLDALHDNLTSLVMVINGDVCDPEILRPFADIILIRNNLGFDAGAYKEALQDKRVQRIVEESDELVLCNDTFFGPFIPLEKIFDDMNRIECDFWGLNLSVTGFEDFLQSYFLVFRVNIINPGILYDFFDSNIDEETTDIRQVLFGFERDCMRYLKNAGYREGAYRVQKHHVFKDPEGSIILDRLPVLKKKALLSPYFDREKTINILSWLQMETDYPVDLILRWLDREHPGSIKAKDLEGHRVCVERKTGERAQAGCRKISEIRDFVYASNSLYIYGIGKIAEEIVELLGRYLPDWREKVRGFVISDGEALEENGFAGCRVVTFSEIADAGSSDLLLALGRSNTEALEPNTKGFHRVMKLWL